MGVYSRWGSIISLSALDWGCIRNLNGWGCNQEWGSNRADTVNKNLLIIKEGVLQKENYRIGSIRARDSIFHYGFLGGVLFKFEQPGGVFKVGLY